jgi:NTE family protein
MATGSSIPAHRDALLARQLNRLFPESASATLDFLRQQMQWVEVAAGETLMQQGAPGDAAYVSISGRLRVYVADDEGKPRMIRELSRGEVIGEMSLFSGEPRSATVVAVRDSVLARLDKPCFEALLASHPQVSITFTRQMIGRLQTQHERRPLAPPVTIGLLPVSAGVALQDFAQDLATQLGRIGRVAVVNADAIDRAVGDQGISVRDGAGDGQRVALAIDELEAEHDFVLLVGNAAPDPWTRHCIQHGDELLLVADATQTAAVHAIEQAFLTGRSSSSEAAEILVLVHPRDSDRARGVSQWLGRRPLTGHVNVRRGLEGDTARLARLLSRTAVGLVLAGGGARGFAHLGIWQALQARGIEIDCVGGTSIGAVMAAIVAADPPVDRAIDVVRKAFKVNPTGDYNLLPLMSLIKGRRVRTAIRRAIDDLVGGQIDIEDLWKGYFCIATNYSQAREQRVQGGNLAHALMASIAIPGALPPVIRDGDLLCDGGTFNNFPVDAMREMRGVGKVIGVDLGGRNPRRIDFDEVPGSWTLLIDRLRPRQKRRYRLPSLMSYLLNMTILYSISRQQQARRLTDLYFNPPLFKVGLLQWARFEQIVRQGQDHAAEVLDQLTEEQRAGLRPAA